MRNPRSRAWTPALKRPADFEPHGLRHHHPVGSGGEHAADFGAHAETESADRARVGAVPVVVEVEHSGQQHAGLHREDVTMTAAAHVEELLHAPLPRRFAVVRTALGGARAAVDHVVVGDHHDLVRSGEASDAERIELALRAHHHPVVDHDEVGVRVDHVARLHARDAAFAREGFFNRGESHKHLTLLPATQLRCFAGH